MIVGLIMGLFLGVAGVVAWVKRIFRQNTRSW